VTDYFFPPQLTPNASRVDILDNAGRYSSGFTNRQRTIGRPGTATRLSLTFRNLQSDARAIYQALVESLGGEGRVYVHDHSHEERDGVTSFAELVPKPTFASSTGFTVGSFFDSAIVDRVMRLTRNQNTGLANSGIRITDAATVTPYRPYVGRMLILPGRGPATGFGLRFGSTAFNSDYAVSSGEEAGLLELPFVPYDSTTHFGMTQLSSSAIAGDYFSVAFVSLAPCALVDNGQNYLPTTDLSNAAWSKTNCTIDTDSVTLPDGSTGTVNTLHEASDTGQAHFIGDNITITAGAGTDWTFGVALKASGRTWAQIRLRDETASHHVVQSINLSTGALGTLSSEGATWGSARASVVNLGNGWWGLFITGRLLTSNTNLGVRIFAGEADADTDYDGTNQDSIYVWRPTLAQSGVPMRLSATSGTALTTGTLQGLGHGIYTKGWPVSTSSIRKTGDVVAINGQFLKVNAPVNSDAAGRAYLQFAGHLQAAPADGDPVILNTPLQRSMLESTENGWTNTPGDGHFTDGELILVGPA
jgi:hypothetical protein